MSVDRLGELLDAATAEVPQRYRTPPLADIHRRVRRRRASLATTASALLVVALLGGLGIARATARGPAGRPPAGPALSPTTPTAPSSVPSSVAPSAVPSASAPLAPVPTDATALPWLAAIVSRDDRTVTVHTGAGPCKQLVRPSAEATVQDAGQVVIAAHGQVADVADCSADTDSVQLTVTLSAALGTRTVRDARTGAAATVFRERYLPRLPAAQWSPVPVVSWSSTAVAWFTGYNGPRGAQIDLTAVLKVDPDDSQDTVTTVPLGTRQGLVSGTDKTNWRVTWQADGATYSLRYAPVEGGGMTLDEFKQLLTTLTW